MSDDPAHITRNVFALSLMALCYAAFQGICQTIVPPAINTLVGTSTEPQEQSYAIVSMHSSNFIAQTTMSPLLGLLLYNFGYSVVYPIVGSIWIVLAFLATYAGLRLERQDRAGQIGVISTIAN